MAETFALLSAAAGLADVSAKASLKLRGLVLDFKNAPTLILALSNEVAEISVVLDRVNESQRAACSRPKRQLKQLFRTPTATSRQTTSGELVAMRTTMVQQQTIISSEMRAIQDIMSDQAVEAIGHKQEVGNQLSAIHNTVQSGSHAVYRIEAEQRRHFEATQAIQMAILTELAAQSNASLEMGRIGPRIQPAPSDNNLNPVISFSMRLPGSYCEYGCRCRCHLPAQPSMSLQIPPMLRAAVGYLFLGYAGYPSASSRCNVDSCAKGKYMRLQVTYCFPFWWCLRYVMHAFVEASTSGTLTFALVARRRMPYEHGSILYESYAGSTVTLGHILRDKTGCIHDVYYGDGRSALRLALNNDSPEGLEIMKLLLQNGADPDQDDDHGISPRLDKKNDDDTSDEQDSFYDAVEYSGADEST
ncbi:hypothetical protein F5X97DRAFT_324438 [Nemania serpens]|nr:hypothetical protein F5X97DRAFT_324438 [Nemania serpens]